MTHAKHNPWMRADRPAVLHVLCRKVTIMARALLGHLPTANDPLLLAEISRLRRRVADLEAQVAELRAHVVDTASDVELHAELHAMTREHQTEPV